MSQRAEWASNENYVARIIGGESWELLKRDTSFRFHDLMNNAMLVSAFKYGAVADAYPEKVNAVESARLRLDRYLNGQVNPLFGIEDGARKYLIEPGNVEYLVDAANFAMIEFTHPAHGNAHYKATDADGSPGRVAANTAIYDQPNQFKNADLADKDERPF